MLGGVGGSRSNPCPIPIPMVLLYNTGLCRDCIKLSPCDQDDIAVPDVHGVTVIRVRINF